MKKIIRNSAKCLKCGDEIVSTDVHDFKWCSCKNIAVDGGNEYLKRVGDIHGENSKDTSISEMVLRCTILSGIPGSGKTTYVENLDSWDKHKKIFSANHYHMVNGVYQFKPENLSKGHHECLRDFVEACGSGSDMKRKGDAWLKKGIQSVKEPPHIVVDNTNTRADEVSPYFQVAYAYGYEVELVTLDCSPEVALTRNTNNVPREKIFSMYKTLSKRKLPAYWNIKQHTFAWDSKYNYYRDY